MEWLDLYYTGRDCPLVYFHLLSGKFSLSKGFRKKTVCEKHTNMKNGHNVLFKAHNI